MAIETRISNQVYEQLALAKPDRKWELRDGRLREKPGMTWEHSAIILRLGHLLLLLLDQTKHQALAEARVRDATGSILIPDLVVVPVAFGHELRSRPGVLAIFADPLPLVIEVWSASTENYDVQAKLPIYQQRGDAEVWLVHPYERTLTAWRRLPDGTYEETVHHEGIVHPAALPEVTIDLEALFGT